MTRLIFGFRLFRSWNWRWASWKLRTTNCSHSISGHKLITLRQSNSKQPSGERSPREFTSSARATSSLWKVNRLDKPICHRDEMVGTYLPVWFIWDFHGIPRYLWRRLRNWFTPRDSERNSGNSALAATNGDDSTIRNMLIRGVNKNRS